MTAIVCWGFGDLAAIAAIHFSSCRWIEKKALAKRTYRRFYLPALPVERWGNGEMGRLLGDYSQNCCIERMPN